MDTKGPIGAMVWRDSAIGCRFPIHPPINPYAGRGGQYVYAEAKAGTYSSLWRCMRRLMRTKWSDGYLRVAPVGRNAI